MLYYFQFLMHSRNTRGRHPLEDHDPNSQDSGFFSVLSEDSRSLTRYFSKISVHFYFQLTNIFFYEWRFEPKTVIEKKNGSLNVSKSDSIVCHKGIPEIDDSFLDNVNSPARLVNNK